MHFMLSVVLLAQWGKPISEYGAYVTCHMRSHSTEQPVAYITTAHTDPAMRRREPIWWPKIVASIFITENLTELFSCRRACAASRPKLVERWTLNGVFVGLSCSSRCRNPFHLTFFFFLVILNVLLALLTSLFALVVFDLHFTSN